MLNHSIVFFAGAVFLAPVIKANHCLATDPHPSDNTLCSIVVPTTATLLLPFDRGFLREHQERIIAVCAESVAGSHCGAAPDHHAYPYLDVSRLSDGQTAAMLREPSKMVAWLKREDNRRLGDLPLRLIEAQGRLTDALTAKDLSVAVERAAMVIALATQVSSPFGTAAPQSGMLSGALRVDMDAGGERCECCLTLRDRVESELIRRNIARVRFEVRPYRGRLRALADRDGSILREMLLAHATLHDLLEIERDILSELNISTSRHFIEKQGPYFDRLGARCLAAVEARLEGGAVLASQLIYHAWTSAGLAERGLGTISTESESNDDGRSGDGLESAGRFVGSARSLVVHQSTCPHAKRILQKNRVYFKSLAGAVKDGRKPCRRCKPE